MIISGSVTSFVFVKQSLFPIFNSDITAGCRGGVAFWFPEARAKDNPAKRQPRGRGDASYRFSEMEIPNKADVTDEELSEGKRSRLPHGQYGKRQSGRIERHGLSRRSDLFSSELLYPAAQSLAGTGSEIKNDIGILTGS